LDIWIFQKALTQRLEIWALASITLGVLCFLPDSDFWSGLAFQFLGWSLVNLGIAGFGTLSVRRRLAKLTGAGKAAAAAAETSNIIFLLRVNTGLDVVYMLGGLALAFFMQARDSFWVGTGLGIVIQGAFLFFFDWYHVRKLG
jgi:hypothetical protein